MRTSITALLLLIVMSVIGQSFSQLRAIADDLYQKKNFLDASEYYQRISELKPNEAQYKSRLADCYLRSLQYEKAVAVLEPLVTDPSADNLVFYEFGYLLKLTAEYYKADSMFTMVIERTQAVDSLNQLASLQREGCRLGLRQLKTKNRMNLQPLGASLNSDGHDFGAIENNGKLVFSSGRNSANRQYYDSKYGGLLPNIVAFGKEGNSWRKSNDFKKLNTEFANTAGCFSNDGLSFYYTDCHPDIGCVIKVSKLENDEWTPGRTLGERINQSETISKHPFLSKTADTLFFVSNRPGGQGGMDIWMSMDFGGRWSPAINMGPTINTPADELSPYYSSEFNALVFSSNGHAGYGGFDIYLAKGSSFYAPEIYNAGPPFNSTLDDLYFSLHDYRGYISTNRDDGGMDIWTFDFDDESGLLESLMSAEALMDLVLLNSLSFDLHAFRIEEYADYHFFQPIETSMNSNNAVAMLDSRKLFGPANGDEVIRVHLSDSLEMLTYATSRQDFEVRMLPDSLENILVTANKKKIAHEWAKMNFTGYRYGFEKIYFDFSSSDLREESEETLRDLVRNFRTDNIVMIDIHTHTDQIGDYNINYKLSENRGLSIIEFLNSQGLSYHQLRVFPNGEKSLLSMEDSWYSRLFNRRAEIVIYTRNPVTYRLPEVFLLRKQVGIEYVSKSLGIEKLKLLDWNGLPPETVDLQEGHVLRVFDPKHFVPNYSILIPEEDVGRELIPYVVQRGETLDIIAKKFGVVEESIMETNHLTGEVKVGDELVIYKY